MAYQADPIFELLEAHDRLVGPGRGAPPVQNGRRLGSAILQAGVTTMSAVLQTAVQEGFERCVTRAFPHFSANDRHSYVKSVGIWGNPNPHNVKKLFFRIGVTNVFTGLSWQGRSTASIEQALDHINQVRNCVAHGNQIRVDGNAFPLRKQAVRSWYWFTDQFVDRFSDHAVSKV